MNIQSSQDFQFVMSSCSILDPRFRMKFQRTNEEDIKEWTLEILKV